MALGFGLRVDLQTRQIRAQGGLPVADSDVENIAEGVDGGFCRGVTSIRAN